MNSNKLAEQIRDTVMAGKIGESPGTVSRLAFAQSVIAKAGTQALVDLLLRRGVIKLTDLDHALEAEYGKALGKMTGPSVVLPTGAKLNGG